MIRHAPSGRPRLGFALALTTTLLWGLLPLALKALLEVLDSPTIVGFRFAVSAVLVGLWLRARSALPRLGTLDRGGWLLLVATVAGLGANYLTYMIGLELTTPAVSQVVIQLAPPLFMLGSLWFFRERFRPGQWVGFAALMGGLGLFCAAQVGEVAGPLDEWTLGVSWVVAAAVFWAVYGVAQKQLLVQLSSQGIMLCVYAVCALAFAPLSSFGDLAGLDSVGWALLAFAAVNTALAYGAFSEALEHWEASRVSAVLSLTPLATIGFSKLATAIDPELFPRDELAPLAIVGAVAVVLGSAMIALGRRVPVPELERGDAH